MPHPSAISSSLLVSGVLFLFLSNSAFAQATQSAAVSSYAATFTVSGTVVSARNDAPLPQTRVTLTEVHDRPGMSRFVITGENGRFEFTSVPAGKYRLLGAHRGFRRAFYDQHDQFSTAIVTGPDLDTTDLVLRLRALAAISGKVTDEAGEPTRNAQIVLYSRENFDGLNQVTGANRAFTDDQGTFEIRLLGAGTYFLSAAGTPWYAVHPSRPASPADPPPVVDPSLDVTYPVTYYNGATDLSAATPITLEPGDHPQIDLRLIPVPSLRVVVRVPVGETGQPIRPPHLVRAGSPFPAANNFHSEPLSPGVYEITGVPPGHYSLLIFGNGGLQPRADLDLRSNDQEVDVTRIDPAANLSVIFKLPGDAAVPSRSSAYLRDPLSKVSYLRDVASQEVPSSSKIFMTAPPGRYSLIFQSGGTPYVVSRTATQGRETPGNLITVIHQAQEITAYLTPGIVTVEGFVKRKGKPVPGAMIVLVPKDPGADHAMFRRDQTDFDGSFTLLNVLPGSYSVFALENAWDLPWGEPDALTPYLPKSQSLTVGALMHRNVILPEPLEPQPR